MVYRSVCQSADLKLRLRRFVALYIRDSTSYFIHLNAPKGTESRVCAGYWNLDDFRLIGSTILAFDVFPHLFFMSRAYGKFVNYAVECRFIIIKFSIYELKSVKELSKVFFLSFVRVVKGVIWLFLGNIYKKTT